MRKIAHVFVGVLLTACMAGAQELPWWCEETPCIRVLAPEEGDTVNPESAFLVEIILTPDPVSVWATECKVHVQVSAGQTLDSDILLRLSQHQRPRGKSPLFYQIYYFDENHPEIMDATKPVADVGDYLPYRFRILGELHLEPEDSLLFKYNVDGYAEGCGPGGQASGVFEFFTSSP